MSNQATSQNRIILNLSYLIIILLVTFYSIEHIEDDCSGPLCGIIPLVFFILFPICAILCLISFNIALSGTRSFWIALIPSLVINSLMMVLFADGGAGFIVSLLLLLIQLIIPIAFMIQQKKN